MKYRTMYFVAIGAVVSQLSLAQNKAAELGSEWVMPSKGAIANVPKPVMPKIDLQQDRSNPAKAKLDIEALMKQYQGQQATAQAQKPGEGRPRGLLAFVSLGMPEGSIKNIIRQASICGATLVIRGFHDRSLTKTAVKIKEVMGDAKVAWKIDPKSFEAYEVTVVPTYILTGPGVGDVAYSKQAGDVSLESFLESVQLQDRPMAATAQTYLKKLRGAM